MAYSYGVSEDDLRGWRKQFGRQDTGEPEIGSLLEENRNLKEIVADLLLERRALLRHRIFLEQDPDTGGILGPTKGDWKTERPASVEEESGRADGAGQPARGEAGASGSRAEASTGPIAEIHARVRGLLERSRIIPAIRGPEFLSAAMASPSLVVYLLFGSPTTIGDVVKKLRSAGKLPIANLDLLTGFAQDSDAVTLLVRLGVAGVVSTHQSVLRAAHAHGIIALQRTFAVDTIAAHNITRSLSHFVPHAIELLPAVAAPLLMSSLRASSSSLPVTATGLVNNLHQVEELVRQGITSVATSSSSLWIL
ncbi:MAG: glycerol-3-phosphate responsive antiterminator [Terracidiphilus sp.]